jgi:outer membrane protein insertion porin family
MPRLLPRLISPFLLCLSFSQPAISQSADAPAATLREIRADGMKVLTEAQMIPLTGLALGSQVSKKDLQSAADVLVSTGLFSKVGFNFQSRPDGVSITFHVVESPRLPVYFDNVPWFSDAELADAIRAKLPFFDGTLPESGNTVDQAAEAVKVLLAAHSLSVAIEHEPQPNPLGDGAVQAFRIVGATLQISRLDFSDPQLAASKIVQQHLSEIRNKPYSRLTIDLFLSEQIRPLYQQQGFLRARLGPPEVHLTGNPNQKLPDQIPVFVPVTPGPVYHWKGVEWKGNSLLSSITLTALLGLKPGDVANGIAIEAAWERIREEYGQRGYLESTLDPVPSYDDREHAISYSVAIQEGAQYRYQSMLLTGMSLSGERLIQQSWPIKPGDIFDKKIFEHFLTDLESHHETIFKDLPVHYTQVGHWLQTDPAKSTVDVLIDFK